MPRLTKRNEVSRVIKLGGSLYMLLPPVVIEAAGIKKGDRLAVDTDGRTIVAVRVPMEDLLNPRLLRRQGLLAPEREDAGSRESVTERV